MPLYVYECKACKAETELIRFIKDRDKPATCEKCGKEASRKLVFTTNRDWFRPFVSEDFNDTPIHIESKQHYRKLCKQFGVTARCLM